MKPTREQQGTAQGIRAVRSCPLVSGANELKTIRLYQRGTIIGPRLTPRYRVVRERLPRTPDEITDLRRRLEVRASRVFCTDPYGVSDSLTLRALGQIGGRA